MDDEEVAPPPVAPGAPRTDADESVDDDVDPKEPIGDADLEIVGLDSSSNGRFCCVHRVCGETVCVGDLLRLMPTIVEIKGVPEPAIKLVKIVDGSDGCTVAFVPRVQASLPKIVSNLNQFCVVKELYATSDNRYKRARSNRNMGMAGVVLLNEIPIPE
jgi:hypothetical protein